MTHARARIGRIGEAIAARHLAEAGLEVLARNWRCAAGEVRGELDLVCRDGSETVFCEVKTRRRAGPDEAAEAVDAAKLRRLRRLAAAWLAETGAPPCGVRFDVVTVSWPPDGGSAAVRHLRGVA